MQTQSRPIHDKHLELVSLVANFEMPKNIGNPALAQKFADLQAALGLNGGKAELSVYDSLIEKFLATQASEQFTTMDAVEYVAKAVGVKEKDFKKFEALRKSIYRRLQRFENMQKVVSLGKIGTAHQMLWEIA